MRSRSLVGLVAALTFAGPAAGQTLSPEAKRAGWHGDYRAARAEARRTGRPIFLVFRCQP